MKTMKLAFAFTMGTSVMIQAQPQSRKCPLGNLPQGNCEMSIEQRAELRAKTMSVKLELSDKQEAELVALFVKQAQEMKSNYEKVEADRKAKHEEFDAEVTKIIGAENMEKIKAEHQKRKPQHVKKGKKQKGYPAEKAE